MFSRLLSSTFAILQLEPEYQMCKIAGILVWKPQQLSLLNKFKIFAPLESYESLQRDWIKVKAAKKFGRYSRTQLKRKIPKIREKKNIEGLYSIIFGSH